MKRSRESQEEDNDDNNKIDDVYEEPSEAPPMLDEGVEKKKRKKMIHGWDAVNERSQDYDEDDDEEEDTKQGEQDQDADEDDGSSAEERKEKNDKKNHERRIQQRLKQILFGKNTKGYDNYLQAVPKEKRLIGNLTHPVTPDAYDDCSKRAFDGRLKKWRRALHQWDTSNAISNSNNNSSSSANSNSDSVNKKIPARATVLRKEKNGKKVLLRRDNDRIKLYYSEENI